MIRRGRRQTYRKRMASGLYFAYLRKGLEPAEAARLANLKAKKATTPPPAASSR
jgi:hypothetical protein